MGIRPGQLTAESLKIVFGGVDREEVQTLLEAAAEDYGAALTEVGSLRARLAEATSTLVTLHEDERETTRTLSRAENDAGAIRQNATRRAEQLLQQAEANVAALLRSAEAERDALEAEIARCAGSRARLVRILQTEIDEFQSMLTSAAEARVSTPLASVDAKAPEPTVAPPPIEPATMPPSLEPVEQVPTAALRTYEEAWSAEDVESALQAATALPWTSTESATTSADAIVAEGMVAAVAAHESAPGRSFVPRVALSAAGVAIIGIVAVLAFPRGGPQAVEAAPHGAAAPVARHQPVPAPAPVPVPAAAGPSTSADSSNAGPASGGLVVRMQATRPCWIGVTIDGEKETRLLGQGEEITRESSSDMIVRVGDAGALIVTVNERRLPPLGDDGEVVTRRITRPRLIP